ncbi:MAG TPA: heavy metal-associated domain-containing protein [Candidatus Cybelea sp.]|nr:heavy metal-associated domain-containing protein [Candidatus Cybelea sp.]
MKQHLARQSGVEKVEVSLIDGKVDVTPKEDGRIDPLQLLKAVYDSGVSVAEMEVIVRGKIMKDSSGHLALQVTPNQSFTITPNDLLKSVQSLADSSAVLTIRGELYRKPAGKKKTDTSAPLKLLILDVQKKE